MSSFELELFAFCSRFLFFLHAPCCIALFYRWLHAHYSGFFFALAVAAWCTRSTKTAPRKWSQNNMMAPWRSAVSLGSTRFNISFLREECKLLTSVPQKIVFISFWEAWTLIEMEKKNWEYTCRFQSNLYILHSRYCLSNVPHSDNSSTLGSKWWFAWGVDHFYISVLYFDKGHTVITKRNKAPRYMETVHWVATWIIRCLCCASESSMLHTKGEKVNVRAVEKGILMASFDSWQDSGLTPTLPLMGGRDPGGTFVQALRLWLFREKWNYESNLAKQCECVCVCVVCKYCKMGREGVMGTTFIHIHLVSCHEHRQHKGRIEGLLWRGIMVMGT